MLKRKNKIIIIICLIIMVISIFIGLYPSLSKKEKEVKEDKLVQEFIDKNADVKITTKNEEEKQEKHIEEDYLMVVEIPKINLRKGIYNINSKNNTVNKNIQIMKESDMPNKDKGMLVLAGHNGNSRVSYFDRLNELNKEDKVYIYYANNKYTYEISNMYEAEKNGTITVKKEREKTVIVLISCKKNTKDKQLVYIGNLINIE